MGLLDKVEKKDKEIQVKEDKDSLKNNEEKNKIFTDMDRIYFEVNKYKNIKLKKLANSLGISKDKIEEYARLLNKEGMIKLNYPFFGSAKLGSIEEEKEIKDKKSYGLLIFTIVIIIVMAVVIFLLYRYGLISFKR